ncbi:hypothetical protein [Wenyingzhuangia sp. 2_MG-2023]|uniref:hypothetical protein n=1 Tax=Wenyingzhuangia sp. 2_MG-2023 TaxID=3062639 RepID=UPI0026E437CE|nr:hypothetical protein [Wenyingzhuangia sp. 2_MG-2023]MDO6737099.1 hypothetical protein [Wenyingzhuangia sp. 2_MG-2023]
MNKGTGAFYKGLQPTQSLSQTVLANENQNFKYRQEQRLTEANEQAIKDKEYQKKRQEGKDYETGLDKLNISKTGSESHDEATLKILQGPGGVFDQFNEVTSALKNEPNNYKLIARKKQLFNAVDTIKKTQNSFIELQSRLKSDPNISPTLNKSLLDNIDKISNNYKYEYKLDDNGNVIVENLGDYDGDGLPDKFTLNDIAGGTILSGLKTKFNAQQWLEKTFKNYGSISKTTDSQGGVREVVKGFDSGKTVSLYQDINSLFGTNWENATDEAKSFIGDTMNIDISTMDDEKFNKIKDQFAQKVIDKYPKTDDRTINYSVANSDKDRALREREIALKEKENEQNADTLRKTADGIVAGIPEYVSSLNITDKSQIRRAEYKNGILEVTDIKIDPKGNESTPTTTRIDTSDPKSASIQVARLLRPKDKADLVIEEYNKGKEPDFSKKKNQVKQQQIKKITEKVDSWSKTGKSQNIIKDIESIGLKGFEDKSSGRFSLSNKIKTPTGEVYNVNTEEGMRSLKEYIKKDNIEEPKEETPKPEPKEDKPKAFDPTKF